MTAPVVLVLQPLPMQLEARIVEVLGVQPTYVEVAALRQQGVLGAVRQMRALRAREICLVLENENVATLLPLLCGLALLSPARSIIVIDANLHCRVLTRAQARQRAGEAVRASLVSLASLGTEYLRLQLLRRLPRLKAPSTPGPIVYINANGSLSCVVGGSIGHVAGVINEWVRLGREVTYFSLNPCSVLRPEVRWHHLEALQTQGFPLEFNLYRAARRYASQVVQQAPRRPAFVYQRLSLGNVTGVLVARRLGCPLILEYNSSEVWVARHWGKGIRSATMGSLAEEVCLHQAERVVTVSTVLRDELIARGVAPERIICHPNGVDAEVFSPDRLDPEQQRALRERHGIPADACVVTFLGTFGAWHGAELLARALARLVEQDLELLEAHRVHVVFVGEGERLGEVRRLLGGPEHAPWHTCTGLVPQPAAWQYLAASDILVSPQVPPSDGTRFFGSPTKLFEYMAMGKAVLASALEQMAQVLTPSLHARGLPSAPPNPHAAEMAVVFTPGELDELVTGLRFLVEQPAWRAQLGSNARHHLLQHYTWSHHVAAIMASLEGEPAPAPPSSSQQAT